jgi:hypothetical protein
MPTEDDMRWFKQQFHEKINAALEGTPYSLDFMTALACQETGEIWPILRQTDLSVDRILELCVGDTLDSDRGRRAFPRTKADLVAAPNGQKMFDIAHQALVDMAEHIKSYRGAAKNPDKFCHGYGIFQYDIQFFTGKDADPDYFLEKRYADFDACLGKALGELRHAIAQVPHAQGKPKLTDEEMAFVAIAYNTGGFNPAKGLKQGFQPPGGKHYGEQIFDFIETSKTVSVDDAATAPPAPVEAAGVRYEVTSTEPLRLRSEPLKDQNNPNSNVIARLPNGQRVSAITNEPVNGFLEIETDLDGKHLRGFASNQFLKQV